jgi:hypothetical protein
MMKTNNFFKAILPMVMVVMAAVCLTSCSKDDDEGRSESLTGTTWQYVYLKMNTSSFYLQLEYTSETDANIQTMMSSDGVVTSMTQPANFTYRYDGKIGTLDWGGSEPVKFTVNGDKLTFDKNTAVTVGSSVPLGGATFIKQ